MPVRQGDILACVISLDGRSSNESDQQRFRLKQLQLERCRYLTQEDMQAYLTAVHTLCKADAGRGLLKMSKCSAPWRFILQSEALLESSDELVELVLHILRVIFPSHALTEKCGALEMPDA